MDNNLSLLRSHHRKIFVVAGTLSILCALQPARAVPDPSASPTPSESATYSPSPTTSPTPSPTPKPSPQWKSICANKYSGKVFIMRNAVCPRFASTLGQGRVKAGSVRPTKLNPLLKARFNALRAAAKQNGHVIAVRSGWRSLQYQQSLFDNAIRKYGSVAEASKWVLPPRSSMHTWGLAIDIKYLSNSATANTWVQSHARYFGLCRVYQNEWWHFEPLISPGDKCPPRKKSASG